MLFNMTCGSEMELQITSNTYPNLTAAQYIYMPLTVEPLAVFLRTSYAGGAELCAYYRADQTGDFTMRVSLDASAQTRLYDLREDTLVLLAQGMSAGAPAALECTILGVKKQWQ
ncbi:MAG: hypothetical protein LBN26_04595 [Christensenellaceae bacterium]|jgi:hypothetical protein|nr:hypothetical protein [Christensenellaceae bacterium]